MSKFSKEDLNDLREKLKSLDHQALWDVLDLVISLIKSGPTESPAEESGFMDELKKI